MSISKLPAPIMAAWGDQFLSVSAEDFDIKPDFATIAARYRDTRPREQIKEHYRLERRLAKRLFEADGDERGRLYAELYTTLFDSLPHHPQHTRKTVDAGYVDKQVAVLKRFVAPGDVFLEVGAGDCRVAIEMAGQCKATIGVDVTPAVLDTSQTPANFRFLLTTGIALDLEPASVDFIYSNQLMEHLHPDDAAAQLAEIFRVLKPGGRYFCITPSALTGPHDVSRYFDDVARGFHLKEYTYGDLRTLFARAGFADMIACVTKGGRYAGQMPIAAATLLERVFAALPRSVKRQVKLNKVVSAALGVALIGRKP
jgi:SAM-dependent methyltransferase